METTKRGYAGTEGDVILPRVAGFLIDHVLTVILGVGLLFAMGPETTAGVYFFGAVAYLGYFVALEAAVGQTVGKYIAGVAVVNPDGTPISVGQALVRNVLRIVDGILNYAVGLVVMLVTDDRQRIGDLAAGTRVVRSRR
ncbi:RDD domain-containing protein [Natronococcus amylolyticus DSM 10524]|uniref:RDD domain-containing protein n=1 Tax=Natronococcus amylolyticus DSM 10524 TaxID=1227497 RepID=L9X8X7_9EURY|nr:RDD family protein [Natronococcus amylolyticus]ELY58180.1 RDD domain-containing protein [Natronococcus amylolyticus DSM 10524]